MKPRAEKIRDHLCPRLLDSVICGDNCEVMRGMPDECIDLVVTSPPYDDLRTYGGHTWDFEGVARELTRALKPGGVIVWVVADATINGSETLTSMRQAIYFKDACGLNAHDTMIYEKAGSGACGSNLAYWQTWEYMLVLSKGSPKTANLLRDRRNVGKKPRGKMILGRKRADGSEKIEERKPIGDFGRRFNVWNYSALDIRYENKGGHPAPFPITLAKDHVASWSNPGDVILDPFAGSGTTLKAAKELGRRFVGIEINAEYVEICQRRIAQEVLNLFPENS